MNVHAGEIKELLQGIAHKHGEAQFQVQSGTVKSVDWDNRVCTVTVDEEYDVPGVRLRALNDSNNYGYCFKPTVDSVVLIAIVYNKPLNAYVAMFSQVDAISLTDGNGTEILSMDIPGGKFIFNGGNNGGLVIAGNAADHFNTIEKDLNTVKTALNAVLNAPVLTAAPGSPDLFQIAMKAALATWDGAQLNLTQASDLETNKVKH